MKSLCHVSPGAEIMLINLYLLLFTVLKEKEGSCPIPVTWCTPPSPPPKCKSDSDCKGKQKCCTPHCHQECTDPVKGNVLPVCPDLPGTQRSED
uniref:WAP domain-containing protein n=1 Tax=Leptobrachium leishanense TaxID=445787 RepID=A0A8C5MDS5_9ANUR